MTEGAERKWMSENLNETNQNQEKDHIRADDATADVVFAESKGFVSHVHLVKSIFHGSWSLFKNKNLEGLPVCHIQNGPIRCLSQQWSQFSNSTRLPVAAMLGGV